MDISRYIQAETGWSTFMLDESLFVTVSTIIIFLRNFFKLNMVHKKICKNKSCHPCPEALLQVWKSAAALHVVATHTQTHTHTHTLTHTYTHTHI